MATGELRERVRERLVSVERGPGPRAWPGSARTTTTRWWRCSPPATPTRSQRRRDRLARAVASFDAATIATTHGFCQEVLGGLGIAGDLEPDVDFVEDLSDLVAEVVDDLYVRRFCREPRRRRFGRAEAGEIARAAIENPVGRIVERRQRRGRRCGWRLADAVRQRVRAPQATHCR